MSEFRELISVSQKTVWTWETLKPQRSATFYLKRPCLSETIRIWELPEFSVIGDDIAGMVRTFCNFAEQHESSGAMLLLVLLFISQKGRGAIYKAFKIAVEKDYDFGDKNSKNQRKT